MTQFQENVVAKGISIRDFIEVDFTITIFGHEILHWHFPPLSKRKRIESLEDDE